MGNRNTRKAERRSNWYKAKNALKTAKADRAARQEKHEALLQKQQEAKAARTETAKSDVAAV